MNKLSLEKIDSLLTQFEEAEAAKAYKPTDKELKDADDKVAQGGRTGETPEVHSDETTPSAIEKIADAVNDISESTHIPKGLLNTYKK